MTQPPGPRYAVYLTPPPGTKLADVGACWLGYDCHSAKSVNQAPIPGLPEVTREPARYGFHGTLRAPFELREGCLVDDLLDAADQFARLQQPLALDLAPRALGRFLALLPHDPVPITALQAALLPAVERYRAPLSEYDRQRRLRTPMSEAQRALLEEWGYPYVLQEFRFHMTLTEALSQGEREWFQNRACEHFGTAPARRVTDLGLAVVIQPDRKSPFRTLSFYPLA